MTAQKPQVIEEPEERLEVLQKAMQAAIRNLVPERMVEAYSILKMEMIRNYF